MTVAIVCGNRYGIHGGYRLVYAALDHFDQHVERLDHVIVGSDRGVDKAAYDWALLRERRATVNPAKWETGGVGLAAGPMRNAEQLAWMQAIAETRVVLAFPGKVGTTDMRGKALAANERLFACLCQDGKTFEWRAVSGSQKR